MADEAESLEREAAIILDDMNTRTATLHWPGARVQHRRQIERAIVCARGALAAAGDGNEKTISGARLTLLRALSARAQDARHGAGQLSRSAQRAPTREACEDGWRRVGTIVDTAEEAAREAVWLARELGGHRSEQAARLAQAAAIEARHILKNRNHAYTFHADPGFSFGEGWYLAAAAVLADVAIQIEPSMLQTEQAERFLLDAGLANRLMPYRSRPRANKQLTEIVARAFRKDPPRAQSTLRAAFLGDTTIPQSVVRWTDRAFAGALARNKVLLWVRYASHHPARNTTHSELIEVAHRALDADLVPILVGDALRDENVPKGTLNMTLFWKDKLFQGEDMRRTQLLWFEHLKQSYGLVGQLGVTTAGMDGPALMGLPTLYFTDMPNVRMREWVGAVPGYGEVVRNEGYLERIGVILKRWARTAPDQSISTGLAL